MLQRFTNGFFKNSKTAKTAHSIEEKELSEASDLKIAEERDESEPDEDVLEESNLVPIKKKESSCTDCTKTS